MTSIKSRGAHKSGERWKHEGHEGFRQVQASVRIITRCPVFWCIMSYWVETPSTPPFICQGGGGVGFTKKIQVGHSFTRLGLYLYLPILLDLSTNYLSTRLGHGPPGPGL
jgi:hypothetical protein